MTFNFADPALVLWDIPEERQGALPHDFVAKRALVYGSVSLVKKLGADAAYGTQMLLQLIPTIRDTEMEPARKRLMQRILT